MSSIFPYRLEYWPAPRHANHPPTVERSMDCGQCPRVTPCSFRSPASTSGPNVPARRSATSEVVSTFPIPDSPHRSRETPPKTGMEAPQTPLRPRAAVTGTRASLQAARTAATCWVSVERATSAGRCRTCPRVAQPMARGHQSRPASALSVGSSLISAQTSIRRLRSAASTPTLVPTIRSVTAADSASMGVTGVGWVIGCPFRKRNHRWAQGTQWCQDEVASCRGHRGGKNGLTLLAKCRHSFDDVGTQKPQHLVGGGLGEDRACRLQPVIEGTLGPANGRLHADGQGVGDTEGFIEHLVAGERLGDHSNAFGFGTGEHLPCK